MSALTLTFKADALKDASPLDCSKLTINHLAGLSAKQIATLPLSTDRNASVVGDYFDITGSDASQIVFKNTTPQLNAIGHSMESGNITIEGDVGDFLGASMQGGQIVCKGNANERVADKMRRGLILIDGNVGAYCASRMIAGTVGIYGSVGPHFGFSLRRGTLLVTKAPPLSATWQDCGEHTLPFLSLMYNSFQSLGSKFSELSNTRAHRWMGDASQDGKGEILLIKP